eukprot:3199729-Amphidinium_carterae.1
MQSSLIHLEQSLIAHKTSSTQKGLRSFSEGNLPIRSSREQNHNDILKCQGARINYNALRGKDTKHDILKAVAKATKCFKFWNWFSYSQKSVPMRFSQRTLDPKGQ